jgi:beta-glucosidase
VLLLAIFPRNRPNDTAEQIETNKQVNERITKFADGKTVRFLNINDKFVGPDGKVPKEIMPDYLHPGEKGYEIWAEAMEPTLVEMLK